MKNLENIRKPKEEEELMEVSRAINVKTLDKYTWINP